MLVVYLAEVCALLTTPILLEFQLENTNDSWLGLR